MSNTLIIPAKTNKSYKSLEELRDLTLKNIILESSDTHTIEAIKSMIVKLFIRIKRLW